MNVLIADDEPLAIERLELLLSKQDGVHILGTAQDGEEAVAKARDLKPDLLLLDIAMPGLDGLEVARELSKSSPAPAVVFVTAFDRFAVAAFDVAAADYLMKPISEAQLTRALGRVRELAGQANTQGQEGEYLQEFWASDRSGLVRVAARDIDRVTAERDYMRLHVGDKSWLIHHSMTALEEGLDPEIFVRLHRSALVRRDFIAGFMRNASGRWVARLADDSEQPVGRLYADRVKEIIG